MCGSVIQLLLEVGVSRDGTVVVRYLCVNCISLLSFFICRTFLGGHSELVSFFWQYIQDVRAV